MKLGSHFTDEQRARLSLAGEQRRGIPKSDITRTKISAARMGIKFSDETKAKLSVARAGKAHPHRGHPTSLETRAKMGHSPSPEERAMSSMMRKGDLNPNWIDGRTPENHRIRNSPEYVAWRTAVFERDGYTCQDCGTHSGMGYRVVLEAHHIHGFAQYLDERFVVDNGKTLCRKCHDKTKRRIADMVGPLFEVTS